MSRSLTNLLGIIITILAGTYFYVNYCSSCYQDNTDSTPQVEEVVKEVPEATSMPFSLVSGDFSIDLQDNFNFNLNEASILMPLADGMDGSVGRLVNFMSQNPGKVLDITGFYGAEESNSTAFPNLGLARANAVKNYLSAQGISSAMINTNGKLHEQMIPDGEVLLGPLSYSITVRDENADQLLEALYEKINASPLVLYFDTAAASINLSPEQRTKFSDLSRYLDKVPASSVVVTGHTDNTGNRLTNIQLGQERAEFAKAYLIANGIAENRVTATSEGPDNPVADNATEEGRAANRRTEITLKK